MSRKSFYSGNGKDNGNGDDDVKISFYIFVKGVKR